MKRWLLLLAGLVLGAALVAWLGLNQRRRKLALLASAKSQSDRLTLLLASSVAITAALQGQVAQGGRADDGPLYEVLLPVSLQASPVLNEIAFPWNGRHLLQHRFIDAAGIEHPGLDIATTPTGLTVVSNEALVGILHLFLFA